MFLVRVVGTRRRVVMEGESRRPLLVFAFHVPPLQYKCLDLLAEAETYDKKGHDNTYSDEG